MNDRTVFFSDKPTITTSEDKMKRFSNARLAEKIKVYRKGVMVIFESGKKERYPYHTVEQVSTYPESDFEGSDNQ